MTRPLTVVQLLPALESGGVERSTLEMAQALTRAGHRAVVVSRGGRLLPQLQASGAEHIALDIGRKSPLTLRHALALRRLLQRDHVDIVHARSRLPAWLGLWALRALPRADRPHWVTTVHGLNSPSPYSAVMTYGERVICVSQTVRDYVLNHYPQTDPNKLRVIARGIDPAMFARQMGRGTQARQAIAEQFPQLGGEGPLLLLPGRGTRLKGHADALPVLAALRATGTDARLWLLGAVEAGRDAYITELQIQARHLRIAEFVAFTPPTSAIAQAYAASDLVLQLSRKPEAFGRTVLEALSVGRPVAGWAHGGVGELLGEWQPQGAVTPFDAPALLHTVQALLARPPSPPATMGNTLSAMQQATLAVYDELVAR